MRRRRDPVDRWRLLRFLVLTFCFDIFDDDIIQWLVSDDYRLDVNVFDVSDTEAIKYYL